MIKGTAESVSPWMATSDVLRSAVLDRDAAAGVCVVGAGIAGLTTAYMLARKGTLVAVLDDKEVGGGETARTTAHLSNALDDRYAEMERIHGEEMTPLIAASHTAAIDAIERIVRDERIDCDFQRLDGYLIPADAEGMRLIEDELGAAHRAGLIEVEMLRRPPVEWFDTARCLRFPGQGQIHPLRYLVGLTRALERLGGRVYRGAHVVRLEEAGGAVKVQTSQGPVVTAGSAVVATNSPINEILGVHLKQAGYRTYVIGARIPRGMVPAALYWDTLDPYHYVRLQGGKAAHSGYDTLIVGGEDHKTGQADDAETRFARLEGWTRRRFPAAEDVEFQWSGEVMETYDGLAYIGRQETESRVFIATGDSGMGMTHGTIAGLMLPDLILGRGHPWAALYEPRRRRMGALGEMTKETLNVARQYASLVAPGEVESVGEIPPGSGAIVRRGLRLIAAHRSFDGRLHERSAICAHLGCVVQWNSMERSWDCPCHGSRYDAMGKVLHGPAVSDLAPARHGDDEEEE
ncbi:MAG TPA: FAD-dependent oxidoreductase [Candidatus Polarisedimenticolia bacterium]|nr:FAD-dependent oxidoreductase [Candidatus Polarisedimenticolia bacterium]